MRLIEVLSHTAPKPRPQPKTLRQPSSCGRYSALVSLISSLIVVAGLYLAKRSYYDDALDDHGDGWKVVKITGRGKGVIATKDIPVCCEIHRFQRVRLTTASKVPYSSARNHSSLSLLR